MDSAADGLSPGAIVVTAGRPGAGGLGAAARDMADGLALLGFEVQRMDAPTRTPIGARILSRRPIRRYAQTAFKSITYRDVISKAAGEKAELLYAMPRLLSAGQCDRRVLHQGMHHPATVRHAMLESAPDTAARHWADRRYSSREVQKLADELEAADLIRVESQSVATDLLGRGIRREKIVHARPGVDLGRFFPGPKPHKLAVAFVGTLELRKGVHVVAELSRQIGNDASLTVCGGPVDPWSRRIASGIVSDFRTDVPAVLATSHALVLPSVEEGFGYVVLEAMASGAVPFVTPQVGAAEVVRELDDRLVVDSKGFAHAVSELLRVLPLSELGHAARAIAEKHERIEMARAAAASVCAGAGLAGLSDS